ncbi:MAG TPA: four helix bundle protein [Gemmatimonadaceae bacterium]|nr:four helix bundle protein [Gemmatimonadaceae bacterium]
MAEFRDLEVYQLARSFSRDVYFATLQFPAHLKRLAAQLVDAAESIGSNIAEGRGRKDCDLGNAELIRYLHFSFASACEAEHRLDGAYDKELLSLDQHRRLNGQVLTIKCKLTRFIQALKRRDRGPRHRKGKFNSAPTHQPDNPST